MTDPMSALDAAREHLAEVLPEPTERQRWALDELDRAIERVREAIANRRQSGMTMFGGGE